MLALVILIAFSALVSFSVFATILSVGKPRQPITPGIAALTALIGAFEVAALAYLAAQL